MAITVACPACSAKLNAPESAAGKRVKCPKCAKILTVPDREFEVVGEQEEFEVVGDENEFEVVDDAAKKAVKRVVAEDDDRPRRRRDEDDDDEDEDDRPRRKKGKKSKKAPAKKSNVLLWVGGCVLALIFATCGGLMLLGYSAKKKLETIKDPDKIEWVSFESAEGGFITSFPGGSPTEGDASDFEKNAKERDQLIQAGLIMKTYKHTLGDRKYSIGLMKFPPNLASTLKPDDLLAKMTDRFKEGNNSYNEKTLSNTSTIFAGSPAKKILTEKLDETKERSAGVIFVASGAIYFIIVEGKGLTLEDPMVAMFLEKFQWKSVAPLPSTPEGGRRRR